LFTPLDTEVWRRRTAPPCAPRQMTPIRPTPTRHHRSLARRTPV